MNFIPIVFNPDFVVLNFMEPLQMQKIRDASHYNC
jgi:hypothetical protein